MEHLKTLASFSESSHDSGVVSSEHCLSDDEILSFAKGKLAPYAIESVHAHLDACIMCQQLVMEAVHALDAEPISETARPSWNAVFQSGALIAKRYRIVRMVERGGMGEVYEAFDTVLQERVALKTVTATHCDNADAMHLLKAEVQLARRIAHPNVCRIFDLGTHVTELSGSETQFLVMEFIDGESLGKKLRQDGPLAFDVAHSVAHQLLRGLAAAHQAGILHRDFKSDNVMLRADSSSNVTAVILDFGLAKVLNEAGNIVTTQGHRSQAMVGTLGYMAPEQIEGEPLSAASDIYAFGIVWFEMLTGRLPFAAETPAASAVARLLRPPEPVSKYNPRVPAWIDAIVMRCLSRHRESRFTSAQAVLDALAAGPNCTEQPARILRTVRRHFAERPARLVRNAWRHRVPIVLALLAGGIVRVSLTLMQDKPEVSVARAAPTRPAVPLITTDIPRSAARVENPIITDTPRVPREASPKVRRPEKETRQWTKGRPTSEIPIVSTAPPPVAAAEPHPSAAAPATPGTAPSLSKPDWLPLRPKRAPSKAQLQVE